MKPFNRNSQFDFGKFIGQSIEDVYSSNPDYVKSCIRNLDFFYVTDFVQLHMDTVMFNSNTLPYDEICENTEMPSFMVFEDEASYLINQVNNLENDNEIREIIAINDKKKNSHNIFAPFVTKMAI